MDSKAKGILRKLKPVKERLLKDQYSDAEYKELVLTMGITEWEWGSLQHAFNDFMARAEGFIKHSMPKDALKELDNAILIRPNDFELHLAYSQAYLQLWKQNASNSHKAKVEFHARKCLSVNAENEKAIQILAQIRNPTNGTTATANPFMEASGTKKPNVGVLVILSLALVAAGAALTIFNLGGTSDEERPYPSYYNDEQQAEVEDDPETNIAIAVAFDVEKKYPNIAFEQQSSILKKYKDFEDTYYTLCAYITLTDSEAKQIILKYNLLDSAGNLLSKGLNYPQFPPGARVGDRLPVFIIFSSRTGKIDDLSRVEVAVDKIEFKAAPKNYPKAKEIPVEWKIQQSEQINIAIKERFSEIKYNSYSKKDLHTLTLEIENKGKANIKAIKINLVWLDAAEKKLGAYEMALLGMTSPKLEPGYVVVDHTVVGIPINRKVASYKIEILDVEY